MSPNTKRIVIIVAVLTVVLVLGAVAVVFNPFAPAPTSQNQTATDEILDCSLTGGTGVFSTLTGNYFDTTDGKIKPQVDIDQRGGDLNNCRIDSGIRMEVHVCPEGGATDGSGTGCTCASPEVIEDLNVEKYKNADESCVAIANANCAFVKMAVTCQEEQYNADLANNVWTDQDAVTCRPTNGCADETGVVGDGPVEATPPEELVCNDAPLTVEFKVNGPLGFETDWTDGSNLNAVIADNPELESLNMDFRCTAQNGTAKPGQYKEDYETSAEKHVDFELRGTNIRVKDTDGDGEMMNVDVSLLENQPLTLSCKSVGFESVDECSVSRTFEITGRETEAAPEECTVGPIGLRYRVLEHSEFSSDELLTTEQIEQLGNDFPEVDSFRIEALCLQSDLQTPVTLLKDFNVITPNGTFGEDADGVINNILVVNDSSEGRDVGEYAVSCVVVGANDENMCAVEETFMTSERGESELPVCQNISLSNSSPNVGQPTTISAEIPNTPFSDVVSVEFTKVNSGQDVCDSLAPRIGGGTFNEDTGRWELSYTTVEEDIDTKQIGVVYTLTGGEKGCVDTCMVEFNANEVVTAEAGICGNNECNAGEFCDGATACTNENAFEVGECRRNCTFCGDGVTDPGEGCDDGNTDDTDECSNSCVIQQIEVQSTPEPTSDNRGNQVGDPAPALEEQLAAEAAANESANNDNNSESGEATDTSASQASENNNNATEEDVVAMDTTSSSNQTQSGSSSVENNVASVIAQESGIQESNGVAANTDSADNGGTEPLTTPTQEIDPNKSPLCGDAICDVGETCDGQNSCITGAFTPGECRTNCSFCGDKIVQGDENCDDGNFDNTDACRNDCTTNEAFFAGVAEQEGKSASEANQDCGKGECQELPQTNSGRWQQFYMYLISILVILAAIIYQKNGIGELLDLAFAKSPFVQKVRQNVGKKYTNLLVMFNKSGYKKKTTKDFEDKF